MDIPSINNNTQTSANSQNNVKPQPLYLKPQKADEFVSISKKPEKKSNLSIAAAGVIIGTVITAAIARKKSSNLRKQVSKLTNELKGVDEKSVPSSSRKLKKQVDELTKTNEELLRNQETSAKKTKELQDLLSEIPDEVIAASKKDAEKQYRNYKNIVSKPLEYNPLKPPLETINNDKYSYCSYFEHRGLNAVSNARTHLPSFNPPSRSDLIRRGNLDFEIPTEHPSNIKANISSDANIISTPAQRRGQFEKTNIKLNYGNNVKWSEQKVARDLMQNFYDGHGHTLEGVKIHAEYNPSTQTYKVKVSGQGEFNHEKIQDFGATSKQEDPRNAGGFGEGAKVMTARMIHEFGVPEVKFASSNWQVAYRGDKGNLVSKLDQVTPMRGNFVEFETKNEKLVDAVLDSTNYFYHPQNPDFKNLTFENNDFAFKFLGLNNKEKGNVYLTQRFEYRDKEAWNNSAENMTLIFKRKPTLEGVIDPNRDRTKITPDEIENLAEHFADSMKNEELAHAISSLQETWVPDNYARIYGATQDISNFASIKFLKGLIKKARNRDIRLEFKPEDKFVSISPWDNVSDDLVADLKQQGYKICHGELKDIGVKNISDLMKELRNHGALQPTPNQAQKIKIIDEAAKAITESMEVLGKNKVLTPQEAVRPTYIFERAKDDNTLAESILRPSHYAGKDYLGHWIARDYLNTGEFSDIVATRLHEGCHKYGGDGNSDFGYKLTDLIADYNEVISTDPALRNRMATLKKIWNEIPKENS